MLGFGLNRLPVLALSFCKRMPCRPDDPGVGVAPFDGTGVPTLTVPFHLEPLPASIEVHLDGAGSLVG